MSDESARPTAVVVGGGLAAPPGPPPRRRRTRRHPPGGPSRLGGLAFSFQRGDLTVDNGQHVYLRCCTGYRWFLDRIDGAHLAPLQDRLDVPVLDVGRPPDPASDGCAAPPCPSR
ncbi:hypothetical protein ID875_32555 [Streptomyces globisporus]|uniref:Uncharacterized protein n=1 Tax=Streptomyces globisporus TaxID=1908 RepID=A0A927GQ95_STRGL|nr:hypothetical protein [Streptomyces globisporus]